MDMKNLSTLSVLAMLACVAFACSCMSKSSPEIPKNGIVTILFKDIPTPGGNRILEEVSVFQAADTSIYASGTLTLDAGGRVSLAARRGSRLYFISGESLSASEGTLERDFLSMPLSVKDTAGTVPDFLYGELTLPQSVSWADGTYAVQLRHGIARIDMKVEDPEKTRISRVVLEDAPAQTLPFDESRMASDRSVRMVREMPEDFSGEVEALFYLFSSARPVHILISGTQDGVPVEFRVVLPVVERSKTYELAVLGTGSDVTGSFSVESWEDGETVIAKPDTYNRILLSSTDSSIPVDVDTDYSDNALKVPNTGAEKMTLAFAADAAVQIASVEGLGRGAVVDTVVRTEKKNGRYISSFDVTIPAQGKGRLGYSVLVNLRYALLKDSYDCVRIEVAPSDKLLETVDIAGRTWMAFNAVSSSFEDQIYLMDDISTVDGMYGQRWTTALAYMFQYGRIAKYVPWRGYNRNQLSWDAANVPWTAEDKMPCPEGWRVPTRDELKTLMPPRTVTVPGSYVSAGDTVSVDVITDAEPLKTETGVGGTARTVRLTSGKSGQSLYLPLGGEKADKSNTNNPGFGGAVVLWSNNSSNTGGYAYGYKVSWNEADSTVTFADNHRPMESFAYVRCIKK